jgi:hypothetical protein
MRMLSLLGFSLIGLLLGACDVDCPEGAVEVDDRCVPRSDAGTTRDSGAARDGGDTPEAGASDAGAQPDGAAPGDGCVTVTVYADADGDGFGDPEIAYEACETSPGYVDNADDCNDACETCHPAGTETCDGRDEDCDGDIDEEPSDGTWYYVDCDSDMYAASDEGAVLACEAPSSAPPCGGGWATREPAADARDCRDDVWEVNPGATRFYGAPISGTTDDYDYNCDGRPEREMLTQYLDCTADCTAQGWSGAAPTECGRTARYIECGFRMGDCGLLDFYNRPLGCR